MKITITGRTGAGKFLMSQSRGKDITHIVSIGTPEFYQRPPCGFNQHHAKKIRLVFHDVVLNRVDIKWGQLIAPPKKDIEKLIKFYESALREENKHFLIHCFAGISRSTASALLLLAMCHEPGKERSAVSELMRLHPTAHPNKLIIEHGDEILGRECSLIDALTDYYNGWYK